LVYESRIAVTTAEFIAATKEKKNRAFTSTHLLHTFVYPLINQGYIDSIESELDHRAQIYFPVIAKTTTKNIELLKNDTFNILLQPSKVNVKDSTTFPDKTYLISNIEGILKYCSEDGSKWTLCDHEGKEIFIEVLVEKYYCKPEDYFNISEEGQNRDVSQENLSEDERTTNNEEKESNKILKDAKFNNSVYSHSKSEDNGPYSCPHCSCRLKTSDLYIEHIERSHKESKLADMAAANKSGIGLLDKGDFT
jgi:hypothetical protein